MQDDWEIKHSLNAGSSADATGNPDGDGFNNLAEYQHNTDPHNPDTDGDGIPDDQDSDPTTPDVVWNTDFWDYYFASQFETYIDGVPSPQWINEPITRPRAVVLSNKHIGDHVDLQWQYLGGPGFQPFLVFYVPQVTLGSIIPDLNAVPLNQIVVGPGGFAPPNGPWGSTITLTVLTNDPCLGFDDETRKFSPTKPLALSVPQRGTNVVTCTIKPSNVATQILFQSLGPSAATVTPSQASSATQIVQVAAIATNNSIVSTFLQVSGYGAQNSFTTVCATAAIDVLPRRTNVTVAIYKVIAATMTNNPPVNVPTQAALKSYLDTVYGQQANVYITVLQPTNIVVNYDLNGNGDLDYPPFGFSPEMDAITGAVYKVGAVNIYYVNTLFNALQNNEGLTYGLTNRAVTFIQDFHNSSTVNVSAHEIGHALGLEHPSFYGQPASLTGDRIMRSPDMGGFPCRLIRDEWTTVNGIVK